MTYEEAKQGINNVLNSTLLYDDSIDYTLTSDDVEWLEVSREALEKAEKYKWHDLRKNPNDLPNEDKNELVDIVYTSDGAISNVAIADIQKWAKSGIYKAWKYREPFKEVENDE